MLKTKPLTPHETHLVCGLGDFSAITAWKESIAMSGDTQCQAATAGIDLTSAREWFATTSAELTESLRTSTAAERTAIVRAYAACRSAVEHGVGDAPPSHSEALRLVQDAIDPLSQMQEWAAGSTTESIRSDFFARCPTHPSSRRHLHPHPHDHHHLPLPGHPQHSHPILCQSTIPLHRT